MPVTINISTGLYFCKLCVNLQSKVSKISRSRIIFIDNFGLSHYTSYLAKGISRYRKVILYGLSRSDFLMITKGAPENVEFHCLEDKLPKSSSILAIIARSLLLFLILLKELNKQKYDIVHVQGYLPTFFLLIPMLKMKRKKLFLTVHDVDLMPSSAGLRGKLDGLYTKLIIQPTILLKYSDAIIVHAQSLKLKLVTKKVDIKKIHVIHHFDYNYLLNRDSVQGQRPLGDSYQKQFQNILPQDYALFFGYVVPWKGVHVLMDASKLVSNKLEHEFNLVIAGTHYYGYESYFNSLFRGSNIDSHIHLINRYIQGAELIEIIKNSSFLVLPYTEDFQHSVSGVIPLAYTFSKPVIVSNLDPLVEYVENGKTGYIFEPGNSIQLAKCIMELTKNKDLCKSMGYNANEKLMREMSLESCSENTNALYLSLEN